MTPYTPEAKAQTVRIYRRPPSWETSPAFLPDKPFVFVGELVDIWESGKLELMLTTRNGWYLATNIN